jgi:hypothetical protein
MNHQPLTIKSDKRFKPGNIKQTGNELRGNPVTMKIKPLDIPVDYSTRILISRELGKKLKRMGL